MTPGDVFSCTYERLPDGSVSFVVATPLQGEVFRMLLSPADALSNLKAFASTMGLVVSMAV